MLLSCIESKIQHNFAMVNLRVWAICTCVWVWVCACIENCVLYVLGCNFQDTKMSIYRSYFSFNWKVPAVVFHLNLNLYIYISYAFSIARCVRQQINLVNSASRSVCTSKLFCLCTFIRKYKLLTQVEQLYSTAQ